MITCLLLIDEIATPFETATHNNRLVLLPFLSKYPTHTFIEAYLIFQIEHNNQP